MADLQRSLKQYFGFDKFKGDQEAIIRCLMGGSDTFVLMPTGGGKSLCYQLPALLMEGTAIVISPLIALMKNQVDFITYSTSEGVAHCLNSSLGRAAVETVKRDILSGRTKLLYVAPESLTKEDYVRFLKTVKISFYAVDEAHCISEWGHDFRKEYRNIRPIINEIGPAPVIALTATATDKVRTDIKKNLGITDAPEYKSSFNRPNLYYEVRQKTHEVDKDIVRFIKQNEAKSGIIYCLSRKKVEELAEILRTNGIKAAPYHAGLDSSTRTQTQDDFLMERIDVIVATIAFGMGIDKPDVRFVIHYDIPKSLEGYYQETGRAGRDGGEGQCIAFYSRKDLQKLDNFMEGKPVAEQDIGRQLLQETAAYAESSVCRRRMLLHYFGETYPHPTCGNCDNCRHPKTKTEARDELVIALKCIKALKEKFRQDYAVDFITGHETDDIKAHNHHTHPLFGAGEDSRPSIWNPLIRQAMLEGYIRKEVENYGLLRLTPAAGRFINNPKSFMIVEDSTFTDEDDSQDSYGGTSALDPTLSAMLTDLRRRISKQLGQPPYVIFQDISIEQMATDYPVTLDELKNIQGVGEGKVKQPYAKEFTALIKEYCEENDIDRHTDIRVKTIPKNSALKLQIVQKIDAHTEFETICQATNLDRDSLISELETIVYSGTKIHIDYILEALIEDGEVDQDYIDTLYEYFQESETDSIEAAIDEFEGFDEEDIWILRLVRIKFMAENALS